MGRPLHPREKHNVPIFLGEHLKSREMVGTWAGLQVSCHLENRDCGPEQRVKVFPVTDLGFWVTELAPKEVHAKDGEDEDEEHEKTKEDGNVVHRAQHHNQLSTKVWKEAHKLQDPQQTERPENKNGLVSQKYSHFFRWDL